MRSRSSETKFVAKIGVGLLPFISIASVWQKRRPVATDCAAYRRQLTIDTKSCRTEMLGDLTANYNGIPRAITALAFHLANALCQTACRFEELIRLTWSDCQRVGEEIVALRIKGKGSVFQDVPVPGHWYSAPRVEGPPPGGI